MTGIVPNLWFDTEGLDAAEFYVSVFPNSQITNVSRYGDGSMGEPGSVMTVDFVLDGQPFTAINGGPQFRFDEAVSFMIPCADQAEVDRYWDVLVEGGEPGRCGWLKDRFGLSWQVIPTDLGGLLGDPVAERAQRAMQAMLTMSKIDLGVLRGAADGIDA
jgi:predicted 3-demethylubiquinone-9 3-methyltransferase (glyoxalase superfamily)